MAINFVRTLDGSDDSIRFQPMERLKVYLFGATVLFASFGMGEAVYRLLFSEFAGATDRIPVEVLFGLVFAWLATKFGGGVYRNRKERSARLDFIWARNHQNTKCSGRITPLAHPSKNQQSIRASFPSALSLALAPPNFTGVSEPTLSCNQLPLSSIQGHRRSDRGVSRRLD